MSQITRCPACQTMFKVVPDQLRISQGWVRCGQCDEVFDASIHLMDMRVQEPASAQDVGQTHAPELDEALARPPSAEEEQAVSTFPDTDIAPVTMEPVLEEFRVLDEAGALSRSLDGHGDAADIRFTSDRASREAAAPEVSFLRAGTAAGGFWRRPWVNRTLLLGGLVLGLGLVVQVTVHERDRIVATEPGLKPLVEAVCALAQCTIAPLRQIDSVVIESSSFNKIRADVYRLNFTLKNTAPIHLAVPAIELSVTDSQEQAIMRRVFMPAEFGVRTAALPGAAESSASIALSIKTNGNADRVAGYLIRTFYP